MAIDKHPAEEALKKAVKLIGYRIHRMPGGTFALYKMLGKSVEPAGAWMTFKQVANFIGANDTITIRQAVEQRGFVWN